MNEPAHSLDALHTFSLAGQSDQETGLETEPNEHDAARGSDVDTLGAQDGQPPVNLDERLLHRDLKARIFGSDARVTIGRYEVLRRIGRGGMGTVYVAHDPELDRKVALKVLRADRTRGRERMLQEARALAKLAHPNVVTVHEVGIHEDRVYVAMELVQGKTLRAWLEAGPSRTALYGVFVQAARGLQAAHRAGLVHRDFKPENVLIGDDGRVRVVDFGVAKATDSLDPESMTSAATDPTPSAATSAVAANQPCLTLTGQLFGTPAYMAPEQFLGASVDARTDLFAFCVALHEALSGRRPFDGDDPASVSASVLTGQPRALVATDVPAALAALVEQGLSREADDRPASLDAIIGALEAARSPVLVPARMPAPRRFPRIAAAVLAAGLGAGVVVMSAGQGEPPPPTSAAASGPMVWVSKEAVDQTVHMGAPEAEAEAEAFAAIAAAATDDDARLAAAEAFLERFGEGTSEIRRAIAHSAAGDVQWRRSCADPRAANGLCIGEQPVAASDEPCSTPTRGRIEQLSRSRTLVESAQQHLRAAAALAGVTPPKDDEPRRAFGEAVTRARVQLADAELESYLTLEVPAEIDFGEARALSQTAFKLFYTQLSEDGARLLRSYTEVKQPGDPRWVLVAAARSGMVSETASNALARTPVPAEAQRSEYCGALHQFVAEPANMARTAYSYCVQKAEEHGLQDEPIAGLCRARLELYPEPS